MDFEIIQSEDNDEHERVISFSGRIKGNELISLPFTKMDRKLISSMERLDSNESIKASDYLLVLEMLFRRYEESQEIPSGLAPR